MERTFKLAYHKAVETEDVPKLSTTWQKAARDAIATKLTSHPEIYGKPLRNELRNYRSLRVGDYRVVFRTKSSTVEVFGIVHRSIVYKKILSRLK